MTLVLSEAVAPGGGTDMAPLHTHDRDDEAFYVLEGTLAFQIGDGEVAVPAGEHIVVPAGTVHTFWNPSSGAGPLPAGHDRCDPRADRGVARPGRNPFDGGAVPGPRQHADRLEVVREFTCDVARS